MIYNQTTIVVVNIIFPLLAVLVVLARLSARRITKLPIGIDDWLVVLALVVTVADAICTINAVYTIGYGNLITTINPQDNYKYLYIDDVLISFVIGIIKCSVVLFYKRIFTTQTFEKVANIVLLICVCFSITATLVSILHTIPIPKYWEDPGFTNLNFGALAIAMNVLDLVLDLLVLSLPLPMIRKLHVNPKKRLAVFAVFGLGMFCVVATSVRLAYFVSLPPVTNDPAFIVEFAEQATVSINASLLWIHIECSASIITACLPTLVPVFTKIKAIAVSSGDTWTRFTRSKTSAVSQSNDSLDLKAFKSHDKGSLQDSEAGKSIHVTTAISIV